MGHDQEPELRHNRKRFPEWVPFCLPCERTVFGQAMAETSHVNMLKMVKTKK